ncbi:hypothetical protein [Leclercia adecarboxylata]|nr:hypothetical protein [Leclercia adecarboxylata]MDV5280099.1 hypothetical protein [Leclercia adecarboxylata]
MNLTGTVGAGVVVRRGRLSDGKTWFWTMQYPMPASGRPDDQ